MESAVPDDIGDIERVPGCGEGDCTGDPREEMEGADGTCVCIGTDARYSAPEDGISRCLLLLLPRIAVGDWSRPLPSRVAVRGRDTGSLSIMTSDSWRPSLRFRELLRPKKGTLMLLLLLPDGLFTRSRSRSAWRRLRLEVFGLSSPLTMGVIA